MSTNRFSWLHLTDFHYGLNGQDSLWPNLREPFFSDLKALHKRAGPWQAVLFTGDFAQSGKSEQFDEMQREVLDRLWGELRKLGSGDAVLLAVPGNHDLCRPNPDGDNPATDTLLRQGGFRDIADKFWNNHEGSYRCVINDAFAAYQKWWNTAAQRPQSGLADGILPGDFACTLSCGSRRIGIIGLNTTFLQLKEGDHRGRLVWDVRQLHRVSDDAVDDWLKKHDVCLLLTHQGPDWLTQECQMHGETEVAPPGRFVAHLFGHMHETKIVYSSTGGGDAVRRCQGCSVFGMEKYGDPPTTHRSHGYTAGSLEFGENDAALRLWPRIATCKTGPWRFVPDHENAVLEDDQGTKGDLVPIRSLAPTTSIASAPASSSPKRTSLPHPASQQSDFITIPVPSWPEDLAAKGIAMPDSMLLRPESGVVGFHSFREPLRDSIIGWALDPDQPIKLRLQAGEGGAGKTRLLIEVCKRLESSHGWRAGFAKQSQFYSTAFSALMGEGKPCLIVLDYAETRSSEIVKFIRAALDTQNRPNIRLVLLAREGGDWWDRLADAAGKDQPVAAVLRSFQTKAGPYRMTEEHIENKDRGIIFRQALQDFAKFKKISEPAAPLPDLSDELFGKPLFIHLAALASLRQQPSVSDKELLAMALGHERSYWRQLLNDAGMSDEILPALEQAIALLSLCNGKRSATEAKKALARTPRLRELEPSIRSKLFDTLRRIYPLESGLAGLQPDLLGETLVSDALSRDPELLDTIFGPESSREDARHALTVLTRLGRRVSTEEHWLKRALEKNLTKLSEDALHVGMETGSPMPRILSEVIKNAEQPERRRAVDALRDKLPDEAINLSRLSIEIRLQFVAFLDNRRVGNETKRHIALCEAYSSLASILKKSGEIREAADAAVKAADHASVAFRSDKNNDRQRLGVALDNLANHLSDVGRFGDALQKAEQAERIRRGLAEKQPDAYTSDWARSLGNLAYSLSDVGRFEDALQKAEQAERIWRGLAEKQPDAYTSDWATSLTILGSHLRHVGRFEDALQKAEQAERIRRGLAEMQPDAHTSDWARTLANLATRLGHVGRLEDALQKAEQAERIWRGLTEKQPDAYMSDWATSLANLAAHLGHVGRFEDALQKAEQAERIRRGLAEKQPDAYTADWATSLANLAANLSAVGRFEDALRKAEQAERIRRALAEKQPDAYTAAWATSLANLADAQLSAGQFAIARDFAKKAISKIRPLAERYRLVYNPWLGFAHRIAAESYFRMEGLDNAVAEAMRSAEIWTEIATLRQNFESIQVAKAFRALIKCQLKLNQDQDAFASLGRVFELLRKPLSDNPRPLRKVLSELVDEIVAIDRDAVARVVPSDLLAIVRAGS